MKSLFKRAGGLYLFREECDLSFNKLVYHPVPCFFCADSSDKMSPWLLTHESSKDI